MGPQHPSTHGVLRFVVKADGEVMREAIPDVGYLHRSIEKIAEKVGYHGFMPYTDRVDYVAAMFCNQGWAMACEKLAGIEVPKRGEYCRVIAAELNRIASHLLVGRHHGPGHRRDHAVLPRDPRARDDQRPARGAVRRAPDLQLHAHRRRRLGPAAGVRRQDPASSSITSSRCIDEYQRPDLRTTRSTSSGCANVAVDHRRGGDRLQPGRPEPARLRRALRRAPDAPYSVYPELEFDVPVGTGEVGTVGDCFDRYMRAHSGDAARAARSCASASSRSPTGR